MGFLFYIYFPNAQYVVESFIFDKLTSDSGYQRLFLLEQAWNIFLKYPILGVGWGVLPVYDLLIKFLSGLGLFGSAFFFAAVFNIVINLVKTIQYKDNVAESEIAVWATALLTANLSFLVVSELGGFKDQVALLWFILGLSIAIAMVHSRDKTSEYNASFLLR